MAGRSLSPAVRGRRRSALCGVGMRAAMLGLGVSVVAGAAAGTAFVPLLGTFYGAALGLLLGVVPSVVGAILVVLVLRSLWPPDAVRATRRLLVALLLYGVVVELGVVWLFRDDLAGAVGAGIALVLLLPLSARRLASVYVRLGDDPDECLARYRI